MARLKVSGSEMVAYVRVPPWKPTSYSNSEAFFFSWSMVLSCGAGIEATGLGVGVLGGGVGGASGVGVEGKGIGLSLCGVALGVCGVGA